MKKTFGIFRYLRLSYLWKNMIKFNKLADYKINLRYNLPEYIKKRWFWQIIGSFMKIIGRKRETDALSMCVDSKKPEFVAIYGRRRVGKTYLVKEFFNNQFSFYATGLSETKTKGQLKAFHESLLNYGSKEIKQPADWFEAFARLKEILLSSNVYREPLNNKIVVFLDELPWMDTARSDFKSALDYFWNSFGSSMEDLLLIVCGSATSWIVDNLLKSRGGFHNRLTRQIHLMPFSLQECEALLVNNGMTMTKGQIIECYMAFGGIPYYLNLMDRRLSLAQNIDELCFKEYGSLANEYYNLFYSLFKKPEKHLAIIEVLAQTKEGKTRQSLLKSLKTESGALLTKNLLELEQCGFIRKYISYGKLKNESFYQLIDPFVLFSLRFLKVKEHSSWMSYINIQSYNAWRGNAFEIVCLNHIPQMKIALGISGVDTHEYGWSGKKSDSVIQIDLLIDRKDGVINLCEMKFSNEPFEITDEEYKKLLKRLTVFQQETGTAKAIHITLVSANGLAKNKYSDVAQSVITGDDLFT